MSRSSLRLKRSLGLGGGGSGSGAVSGAASREAREAGITAEDGDGSDGGVLLFVIGLHYTAYDGDSRRRHRAAAGSALEQGLIDAFS